MSQHSASSVLRDETGAAVPVGGSGGVTVADTVSAGQYRTQSVTTAAELLGAGSILANRKIISITPMTGTLYWGFDGSVTTANGTPLQAKQTLVIPANASLHIFGIANAGSIDVRVAEMS